MSKRTWLCASAMLAALVMGEGQASAQRRDSVLNGVIIGAAVGAGIGIGMNYALRDSDLTVGQYAYGAAVYGAIGAGIGLGVDALLSRKSPRPFGKRPRLLIAPTVGHDVASAFSTTLASAEAARQTRVGVRGLAVQWRW
jgi:hypothetical protein